MGALSPAPAQTWCQEIPSDADPGPSVQGDGVRISRGRLGGRSWDRKVYRLGSGGAERADRRAWWQRPSPQPGWRLCACRTMFYGCCLAADLSNPAYQAGKADHVSSPPTHRTLINSSFSTHQLEGPFRRYLPPVTLWLCLVYLTWYSEVYLFCNNVSYAGAYSELALSIWHLLIWTGMLQASWREASLSGSPSRLEIA